MGLDQYGLQEIGLIQGERIDCALNLAGENGNGDSDSPRLMLLTDRRVIHVNGSGKKRKAVFASIKDIDAVEVTAEGESKSAFIWAALAFFVAILLYFVLSEQPIWRIVASAIVALMGVYLIVDQVTSSGKPVLIFKTGSSELRCGIHSDHAYTDVYYFINRLFQLKEDGGQNGLYRPTHFAPR